MLFTNNNPARKTLRQRLRKEQTLAEGILWQRLRNKQLKGFKFYRQFGIDRYVLDFYCVELDLAIELDGGHHSKSPQSEYDLERTVFLNAKGIKVIRFWNNEVLTNIQGVLERIDEVIKR